MSDTAWRYLCVMVCVFILVGGWVLTSIFGRDESTEDETTENLKDRWLDER